MARFGFNINFRHTPDMILDMGEKLLGTNQFHGIEVTYYENMEGIDTHAYNEAIRKISAAYHPEVVVHISDFNLSEENSVLRSAMIHEFRNCCKYTRELGGDKIVIHCGDAGHCLHVPLVKHSTAYAPSEFERCWTLSVEMMKTCCDIAKECGIIVYTENLNRNKLTVRCDTLNQFLDAIDRDNLFIVFDIGHCNHTGGQIVPEVLECGTRLRHLHLHDNFGESDDHLPVGEATIDWKAFCDALKQINYSGLYMMEVRFGTVENLRASRERLLQCM